MNPNTRRSLVGSPRQMYISVFNGDVTVWVTAWDAAAGLRAFGFKTAESALDAIADESLMGRYAADDAAYEALRTSDEAVWDQAPPALLMAQPQPGEVWEVSEVRDDSSAGPIVFTATAAEVDGRLVWAWNTSAGAHVRALPGLVPVRRVQEAS